MIIGYGVMYYYNPHINLDEILEPLLNKIDVKMPENFPITFVAGTFIYKFITISISYFTGDNLNIFTDKGDSLSDEDRKNIKEIINNYKNASCYSPTNDLSLEEQEDVNTLFPKDDEQTPKASNSNLPESTSYENRPLMLENPYNKVKGMQQFDSKSIEIKLEEDWS